MVCSNSFKSICNKISNENLKLINRLLEAEISIERTKNILLRKIKEFQNQDDLNLNNIKLKKKQDEN